MVALKGHQQERVTLQPRMKANNVFAVRNATIAGLGIAQLPLIVAKAAAETGQLRPILSEWSLPKVPIHAVFASARYLTPKVRGFIDLAVDAVHRGVPPSDPSHLPYAQTNIESSQCLDSGTAHANA